MCEACESLRDEDAARRIREAVREQLRERVEKEWSDQEHFQFKVAHETWGE